MPASDEQDAHDARIAGRKPADADGVLMQNVPDSGFVWMKPDDAMTDLGYFWKI